METKRLQWLDVAKGITIILMVLGHTSIPWRASNFIFAFHMPLFFIASGWCTSWGKYKTGEFVLRKVKTLLVPFIVYSAAVILIAYLTDYKEITLGGGVEGWKGYALWFVPVLFFAMILAKLITIMPVVWVRCTVCVGLIVLGALMRYYHVHIPWTMATVPYATFLVLFGSSMKKYSRIIEKPKWWVFVLCLLLTVVISQKWRLDLAWNSILPVSVLTIGALTGTVMMFIASSYLSRVPLIAKVFAAIGKETFVVLAFSQILCLTISHYYPCNKIIEYGLMFGLLFVIVLIKNGINRLIGRKVL